MAKLLDDIRRLGRVLTPHWFDERKADEYDAMLRQVWPYLLDEDTPVLLIDNVANYYYEGTGQEEWDLTEHFPNMAPPYQVFWAESRLPKRIHSDTKGDTDVTKLITHGRSGWLVFGLPVDQVKGEGIPENVRWVISAMHFLDWGINRDEITGPDGILCIALDAEGRIVNEPWHQSYARPEAEWVIKAGIGFFHPVLLAISFLHCRNVTVVDNEVPPKLAKKTQQRHGYKPCQWKTLVIEPLKQILRREGRSGEVGTAKAMHICRGHFKDYREGRGLFGKYKMLVWHDAIVRGTRGTKAPHREIEVKV